MIQRGSQAMIIDSLQLELILDKFHSSYDRDAC